MLYGKKIFLASLALFAASTCALAQSPDFSQVEQPFRSYQEQHLQEKLYLQTDRNFHLAGELLWFSVRVVDGTNLMPLDLSKVAYVELLDMDGQPQLQAKIALAHGRGEGSFFLPLGLSSGNYVLRAYTAWMKNAGPQYYFHQTIRLVNSFRNLNAPSVPDSSRFADLQFMPEGGNLVAGIPSVVAFKATDRLGRGINIAGAILNSSNDTVQQFSPLALGMGQFEFTPLPGESYYALARLENGTVIRKLFPFVYQKGYVMRVTREAAGGLNVRVTAKTALEGNTADAIFLVLHARQKICLAQAGRLQNGQFEFHIPAAGLPAGVLHFTLFNGARQPVCERLLFRFPEKKLNLEVATSRPNYGIRDSVTARLRSFREDKTATAAHYTLSVYRLDGMASPDPGDIFSYLWLQSELPGRIESPSWYFEPGNALAEKAMDNLMLTQGWRRFRWDDILNAVPPDSSFLPEIEGLLVTGSVTSPVGQPMAGTRVAFSVPGQPLQFYQSLSDDQGRIYFATRDIYGKRKAVIKAFGNTGTNYRLHINDPFDSRHEAWPAPSYTPADDMSSPLLARHVSMQVQNVFEGEQLDITRPLAADSLPFFGVPRNRYRLDDYTRFVTMEEVLREYVLMIAVRRYGGKPHLRMIDERIKDLYTSDPLILLDAVPVSSDSILGFDPLKVNIMQLTARRFIKGAFVYDGVVSFETYDANVDALPLDPSALVLDFEGLQEQRIFYSPVYDSAEEKNSKMPDFRELLYWQANHEIPASGAGNIRFFTSDVPGKYVMVLEGLDDSGRAGSCQFQFTVTDHPGQQ